ncbi:hypothetical protein [Flavobacterium sp. 3HN19-14]|uniref:hypothetical protein n=1 Tax=Flavobacterium sp. 3HN19-14 TaxID=3448133 RepID=UPI003EDE96E1
MKKILLFLVIILLPAAGYAQDYFVSNNGTDAPGYGTLTQPFATIQYASTVATAGSNVNVMAGTYYWANHHPNQFRNI